MSEYETDILVWSEHQAALLRRLAAGERVDDQIDWENVIEEVESVGAEQLHAVVSLLRQALIHRLKAEAWPLSRDAPNWRADAIRFRADAVDRYAPSMRQRIVIDRIYRQALHALPDTMDGVPPLPIQTSIPMLDELLAEV
ncbi:MAG TPA: DUF29 domain-containing protein [Acetobacteraceae bacterium]|jgi:hypothetical protein